MDYLAKDAFLGKRPILLRRLCTKMISMAFILSFLRLIKVSLKDLLSSVLQKLV